MTQQEQGRVVLSLGGWNVELLTAEEWDEAIKTKPLSAFAGANFSTPFVYVVCRPASNTRDGKTQDESGTFFAPCGVPEDTPEALYVALINAQAHEALEWVQVDGKPYFDPHTEVGDYMLVRTLKTWLEWKTGQIVVLIDPTQDLDSSGSVDISQTSNN